MLLVYGLALAMMSQSSENNQARPTGLYLLLEAAGILGWSYVILVGGGITGVINFRLQAANAVLSAIVLGGWLLMRILRHERLRGAKLALPWMVFLAGLIITAAISSDPRRSVSQVLLFSSYGLFFFFWKDALRKRWQADLLEKALLIAGGILLVLSGLEVAQAYASWRQLAASVPYAPPFAYRLYALGDANLGAAVGNLLLPLALARALRASSWTARIGWAAYMLSALGFLLFTASRGGWLGSTIALVTLGTLVVWHQGENRLRKKRRGTEFSASVFGSILMSGPGWMRGRGAYGLGALLLIGVIGLGGRFVLRQASGLTHGPILESRSTFWGAAWAAFKEHPLVGTGPGTFPSDYVRYVSAPPDRVYAHAHSLPFTLAAETGLIGLMAAGVLLLSLGRAVWRAGQEARRSKDEWMEWAGRAAALAGLAGHSLFDNHLIYPAVGLTAVALVALASGTEQKLVVRRPPSSVEVGDFGVHLRRSYGGMSPWLLALPGLALAIFAGRSLRAYAAYDAGLDQAVQGNWREAAAAFDRASALDPSFALYSLHSGYAYGRLAHEGAGPALQMAIDRYERGLEQEPDFAPNQANLAALYFQAGQPARAIRTMTLAYEWAPESSQFALNLGAFLDSVGDARAGGMYRQALALLPGSEKSNFWLQTERREQALREAQTAGLLEGRIDPGMEALDQGDLAGAESYFVDQWRQAPLTPGPYVGLAQVAQAAGNLQQAKSYYLIVLSLQLAQNESKVAPLIALGEIARQEGEEGLARMRYQQAYEAVVNAGSYGWGAGGFDPYAWFTFGRRSLPVDLLPQLVRADVPSGLAERLLPLVELADEAGEAGYAAQVLEQLHVLGAGKIE